MSKGSVTAGGSKTTSSNSRATLGAIPMVLWVDESPVELMIMDLGDVFVPVLICYAGLCFILVDRSILKLISVSAAILYREFQVRSVIPIVSSFKIQCEPG